MISSMIIKMPAGLRDVSNGAVPARRVPLLEVGVFRKREEDVVSEDQENC